MRTNLLTSSFTIGTAFILFMTIGACKKDHNLGSANNNAGDSRSAANGTRKQLTLDSIFLYAKQIYFWNDALPEYTAFQPRNYSGKSLDLDNYNDELYALTQFKINPATGKPYEFYGDGFPKYSFIDDLTLDNPAASSSINNHSQASVDTEGNGNDIGIRPIAYLSGNSLSSSYSLFVTAVYQNSPAEAAGVQRGWVIQKINGTSVGANYSSENSMVQNALAGSSVKIEGINFIDKVPFSLTLNKRSYKSSPVYASKVISRSGKKIGYLAFARFSVLTNEDAPSDANLDPVFSDFSTQGVTDLIVDLRYNGGGYVNTAEYLANLIAPSSANGKKMFTELYNTTMQNGQASILANQPLLTSAGKVQFQNGKMLTYADLDYTAAGAANNVSFTKKGSLSGVNNIVFIVSGNTASASELLINSLKPYMNVKLVGDTTYGKPVGFFPFTLENRYQVYMPLFETRNANNEGGYYTGMVPNVLSEFDDPEYPFGDERENYMSLALNTIAPNAGTSNQGAVMSIGNRSVRVSSLSSSQLRPVKKHSEFIGMIEKRHNQKK